MKVVSFLEGVTRQTVNWDETRPLNGAPLTGIVQVIADIFKFEEAGIAPQEQIAFQAPIFRRGLFEYDGKKIGINSIEVHKSSVTVSCSRTEYSDAVLDAVMSLLREEFDYRQGREQNVSHRSTIVSDLGFDISSTIGKWNSVCAKLAMLSNLEPGYKFDAISTRFLAIDPAKELVISENQLVVERRFGSPSGEFWFFTVSPLKSKAHVELLEFMVETFAGKNAPDKIYLPNPSIRGGRKKD